MKVSTVCKIFFTVALAITVVALGFVAIKTVNPSAFGNLAESIPLLKRFVVKTYPTRVYGMAESEANALKIARYDIDFLASFSGPNGRYIALYPFSVEAEIPLDGVRRGETKGSLSVPDLEYVASVDQAAAASMVFMDTLELDYNSMLAPVLSMYREKCVDLAMADPVFLASCKKKAETYFGETFGAKKISWKKNAARPVAIGGTLPIPVEFGIEGDRGRTELVAENASLRDAFTIRTSRFNAHRSARFRFGRAGRMTGSFGEFEERMEKRSALRPADEGRILFRYQDPMRDDDMTFVSFADSGYRAAFVYLRGGSDVYYVEATGDGEYNDEEIAQRIAPATLYLAASSLPPASESEGDASASMRYGEYCRQYEAALKDVKAHRFGRSLELSLDALDRLSLESAGRPSSDADMLRKIMSLKNGSDGLIADVVKNEKASLAPGSFGFSASENRGEGASEDENLRGNVEALLWEQSGELGIPEATAQGYKRDLISKGTAMNRKLAASLTAAERNEFYANFFLAHLPADKARSLYVGESGAAETWLYYGAGAVKWKEKKTQRRVAEKLGIDTKSDSSDAGGASSTEGSFIFIFSEPEGKASFFTRYDALVLDEDSVAYSRNFARWLPFTGGESLAAFKDLEFIEGSVKIGKQTLDGKEEIVRVLKGFKEAFSSDGYAKERVAELVSENLEKKAIAQLERPRFE